eukprot:TRINITY_DN4296_c4_g2_i1.p1 TRINITY_DN4296_c4_g2~~TRINITY_DN4296_c4_g2_i1.p1  ORF type:complete len:799 (+),score=295.57 TRINITY_DN4296_c4_g2_i1:69-2399(+)
MEEVLKFESARRELEQQLQTLRVRKTQVSAELDKANARLADARRRESATGVHDQLELEVRSAADDVRRFDRLADVLSKEYREIEYELDDLVQSISVLKEEEERLMDQIRSSGKGGGCGTDQFRRQASDVASLLSAMADVQVFDPAPGGGKTVRFGEWELRQREKQKEAKEELFGLRREVLRVVNQITYYGDDRQNWSAYVNKLELQYIQALVHCAAANLQRVLDANMGQGPDMYSVALKLNTASRLAFTPLVNDVPTHVAALVRGILATVSHIDHLHCSLNIPADVDAANRKPLSEVVSVQAKVKEVVARLHSAYEKVPDTAVEFVCKLEDDFKDVWFGELGGWDAARLQHAMNKLEYGWDAEVPLGGVCVDTSALRDGLRPILAKALSGVADADRRESSDVDVLNQSEDALAVHYSPPRLSGGRQYVNPLLQNPPEELEARWRQEQIDLRDRFRERERRIAESAKEPPVSGVGRVREQSEEEARERARAEEERRGRVEEERRRLQAQEAERRKADDARRQVEEDARRRREAEEKAAQERAQLEREREELRREEALLKAQEDKRAAEEKEALRQAELAEMERQRKWEEEELMRRRRQLAKQLGVEGAGSPGSAAAAPAAEREPGSSLAEIYRRFCSEQGIKPNSGVCRILPKEPDTHMSELNLGLNYIGIKGIQPLLEVLRRNQGLQVLNLCDNNLENAEVRSLVQVLLSAAGSDLTTLNLANNPISLAGGSALVDLITRQKRITHLQVDGTLIQPKVLDRIEEQLRANRGEAQQP